MSTDPRSRRTQARRRRGRRFAGAFAIAVGVLAVVGAGAAFATVAQGPRVTEVQVDPAAAIAASGSRLIVTTTQSLAAIDPAQVTVEPQDDGTALVLLNGEPVAMVLDGRGLEAGMIGVRAA